MAGMHLKFSLLFVPQLKVMPPSVVAVQEYRYNFNRAKDPKPHAVIQLWKSHIEEGKLNEQDPSIIIFDKDTESRYEILSADEGDIQMPHQFYDTFRGTAEVVNRIPVQPTEPPIPSSLPANSPLAPRYAELARAINALVQSAKAEGVSNASSTNIEGWPSLQRNSLNSYIRPDAPAPSMTSHVDAARSNRYNGRGMSGTSYNQENPDASSAEPVRSEANVNSSGDPWRRCVICLGAPVEGACLPCSHMAFCMACLKEIKFKNGSCPVCRATINNIIRLYLV